MHAAELLHAHPDIVICRDAQERITHVNPAFLQHFGGSKRDWFGKELGPAACGAQIGAFYEDRMYGHLHSKAGSFWVEWVDTLLGDGQTMSCGRVNPDRRRAEEEPPNGICRRKNHVEHVTLHAPVEAPQMQAFAPEPAAEPTPKPVPEHEPAVQPQAGASIPEQMRQLISSAMTGAASEPVSAPVPEPAPEPADGPPVSETAVRTHARPPQQPATLSPVDPLRKYLPQEPAVPELDDKVPAMPVARDQSLRKPDVGSERPVGPHTNILLAEDDPLNAKLAMALLENEGCNVTHVEDGRKALEAAQTGMFDLVFMDMRMPVMDGLQATRAIRALGGVWETTPILALTANAFSSDKEACKASGMDGFITKPITVDGLLAAKRHWTNKTKQAKTG